MSIRILLVDDHQILRDGLRLLIEQHDDMQVVGEAEDGLSAIRLAGKLTPDVILMDITLPAVNGIDATQEILKSHPNLRIIALSMHSDRRMVARILSVGAVGYLLKESAFEELIQAIRTVVKGGTYLSPTIAQTVVEEMKRAGAIVGDTAFTLLSQREREVLQLLAEGQPTKQIAAKLCVSTKTVETHRRQIMEKLQLFSLADLTKYAVREGLTPLD